MGMMDDPNFYNNLLNFGAATMAAAGQPGARTGAALGAGVMGMNQAAQQRAQTQLLQQEAQTHQLQNQLIPYQMKLLQAQAGLYGSLNDEGDSGIPAKPSSAPASTSWSATAGGAAPSSRPVNNPGNLRPVGSSTGFQQFSTPQAGLDAMKADLVAKVNGSPSMKGAKPTIRNILSVYAPPSENDTPSYIKNVSQGSGLDPDQPLSVDDIDKILPLMVKQEGNASMLPMQQVQQNIPQVPGMTKRQIALNLVTKGRGGTAEYEAQSAPAKAAAIEAAKLPYQEQESFNKKRGETFADQASSVENRAQNAIRNNSMLTEMQLNSNGFKHDIFTNDVERWKSYAQGIGNILGVPTPKIDKELGDYQTFVKNSSQLLREAVRDTSSRAAVQEFPLIEKGLPTANTPEIAMKRIFAQMKGLNDYDQAVKHQQAAWLDSHPTTKGFRDGLDKNISPLPFIMHRMSSENEDEYRQLVSNLQKTKQGKNVLLKINEQTKYAIQNGMFDGLQ